MAGGEVFLDVVPRMNSTNFLRMFGDLMKSMTAQGVSMEEKMTASAAKAAEAQAVAANKTAAAAEKSAAQQQAAYAKVAAESERAAAQQQASIDRTAKSMLSLESSQTAVQDATIRASRAQDAYNASLTDGQAVSERAKYLQDSLTIARNAEADAVRSQQSATITFEAAQRESITLTERQIQLSNDLAAAQTRSAEMTAAAATARGGATAAATGAQEADAAARSAQAAGAASAAKAGTWGLAIAGTAYAVDQFTKSAADFQKQQELLVTTAGEAPDKLAPMSQALIDMAGEVGVGAQELSKAMYTIKSAGQDDAQALNTIRAAAQGASIENADVNEVAKGLTTTMHDFNKEMTTKGLDAYDVQSKIIRAVGMSKTSLQEFSTSLASVEPAASAAGMSMEEVYADISQMTQSGMNAQRATQQLNNAIGQFEKPSIQMQTELSELGIRAQDLTDNLGTRGLSGTVDIITKAILEKMGPAGKVQLDTFNQMKSTAEDAKLAYNALEPATQKVVDAIQSGEKPMSFLRKNSEGLSDAQVALAQQFFNVQHKAEGFNQSLRQGLETNQDFTTALVKATGDQSALSTAFQLGGTNADTTAAKVRELTETHKEADQQVQGNTRNQETYNQKMKDAKASFESVKIELGDIFLPAATHALDSVANYVQRLVKEIANLTTAWNAVKETFKGAWDWVFGGDGADYSNLGNLSVYGNADGGPISGPGTGTSDSILARVSNGEYIIKADRAHRNRPLLDAINNAPGYQAGGAVGDDDWYRLYGLTPPGPSGRSGGREPDSNYVVPNQGAPHGSHEPGGERPPNAGVQPGTATPSGGREPGDEWGGTRPTSPSGGRETGWGGTDFLGQYSQDMYGKAPGNAPHAPALPSSGPDSPKQPGVTGPPRQSDGSDQSSGPGGWFGNSPSTDSSGSGPDGTGGWLGDGSATSTPSVSSDGTYSSGQDYPSIDPSAAFGSESSSSGNTGNDNIYGGAGQAVTGQSSFFNDTGKFGVGEAVSRAWSWLQSVAGRPYIYGGLDCSGTQSGIYNSLIGKNPLSRSFSTVSDFGALGFEPGLGGTYSIGVTPKPGQSGHMAGTFVKDGIAHKVESGGSHGDIAIDGPAVGADDSQFSMHYHLPGSRFKPPEGDGGIGSGSSSYGDGNSSYGDGSSSSSSDTGGFGDFGSGFAGAFGGSSSDGSSGNNTGILTFHDAMSRLGGIAADALTETFGIPDFLTDPSVSLPGRLLSAFFGQGPGGNKNLEQAQKYYETAYEALQKAGEDDSSAGMATDPLGQRKYQLAAREDRLKAQEARNKGDEAMRKGGRQPLATLDPDSIDGITPLYTDDAVTGQRRQLNQDERDLRRDERSLQAEQKQTQAEQKQASDLAKLEKQQQAQQNTIYQGQQRGQADVVSANKHYQRAKELMAKADESEALAAGAVNPTVKQRHLDAAKNYRAQAANAKAAGDQAMAKSQPLLSMGSGAGSPSGMAYDPHKGVSQWSPLVGWSLQRVGQPLSYSSPTLKQIQIESSGNPRALGPGSSDGNPRGLLQVKPGTFTSYRDSGLPNDAFDPAANIVAAMNYVTHDPKFKGRGIGGVWPTTKGYDQGGWLQPGLTLVHNMTGKPEPVLNPEQKNNLDRAANGPKFQAAPAKGVVVIEEMHNHGADGREVARDIERQFMLYAGGYSR